MILRELLVPSKRRLLEPLRIIIYARYSTDEQKASSIHDQVNFVREQLEKWNVKNAIIDVIQDQGVSGEQRSRHGIDEIRRRIMARLVDAVLSEDSSRLYRDMSACFDLVGAAVDNGIRVICINDDVDTANDDWEQRLHDAQNHHSRDNYYTSLRIKRSHNGLWKMGAAIGLLKPGYIRRPTKPATDRDPAEGPFFDEVDPKWVPIILEVFTRIGQDEPAWSVADFLTAAGLPKSSNALDPKWSKENVISLIRNPIYRGEETFRKTVTKKKFGSGKRPAVRNDPGKIEHRKSERLRMVPDAIWYRANDAIDARKNRTEYVSGQDHPLANTSRETRTPLSGIFICDICEEIMHADGRRDGGYRCSEAKHGPCWNKATALRSVTHDAISAAIVDSFLSLNGYLDELVGAVSQIVADANQQDDVESKLFTTERELVRSCERLAIQLEKTDDPPETLLSTLQKREKELKRVRAEIELLRQQRATPSSPPTRDEILRHLDSVKHNILKMTPQAKADLKGLLEGPIRAVPYQQFGGNKVVLRAEFTIGLFNAIPRELSDLLKQSNADLLNATYMRKKIVVDLFEPSAAPKFAVRAAELRPTHTLVQIGNALGIPKRQAHLAAQMGREMQVAGITDPFQRLTVAPQAASRWRTSARVAAQKKRSA